MIRESGIFMKLIMLTEFSNSSFLIRVNLYSDYCFHYLPESNFIEGQIQLPVI